MTQAEKTCIELAKQVGRLHARLNITTRFLKSISDAVPVGVVPIFVMIVDENKRMLAETAKQMKWSCED